MRRSTVRVLTAIRLAMADGRGYGSSSNFHHCMVILSKMTTSIGSRSINRWHFSRTSGKIWYPASMHSSPHFLREFKRASALRESAFTNARFGYVGVVPVFTIDSNLAPLEQNAYTYIPQPTATSRNLARCTTSIQNLCDLPKISLGIGDRRKVFCYLFGQGEFLIVTVRGFAELGKLPVCPRSPRI